MIPAVLGWKSAGRPGSREPRRPCGKAVVVQREGDQRAPFRVTVRSSMHPDRSTAVAPVPALAWAHPVVQEWFVSTFGTPTEPQEQGWPHILGGRDTLISAPTGSGKTLAAVLACIDRLVRQAPAGTLGQ